MLYPSAGFTSPGPAYPPGWWNRPLLTPGVWLAAGPKLNGQRQPGYTAQDAYSRAGRRWPGFNSNFYNRIVVTPSVINMGNLTSSQTRYVKLWNGFVSSQAFTDFQGTGTDGMNLSQPVVPPATLLPLQELTYVLSVSTDGPAQINARYTWTVSGGKYTLDVTGQRVIMLAVAPNWNTAVIESLEWRTDVMRAYSGKEQRRQLRLNARRGYEYDFMVTGVEAQMLDNQLWGWQHRMFAVPAWAESSRLTAPAANGSKVVAFDTTARSYSATALVVLVNGSANEVVEIDSITAGGIVTKNGLQQDWPVGTSAYPLMIGHLATEVSMARHNDNVLSGKIVFKGNPGQLGPYTPAGTAPETYQGLEVLLNQPNWKSAISFQNSYKFDTVDYETGVLEYLQTERSGRVIRAYSWLLPTRTDILAFRQFLGRMAGQLKTCWVPTWTNDFTPVRAHFASDTSLTVVPNGYRALVGADPNRSRIMIRLRNGQRLYRTITGVSSDGVNDILGLDSALGVDIPMGGHIGIHLLLQSRLASDTVNLEWQTGHVVVVQANFTSVPVL